MTIASVCLPWHENADDVRLCQCIWIRQKRWHLAKIMFYLFFMDSSWEQRCTLDFLILDFSSAIHTIQPIIISQCQILILLLDWLKLVGFFFCFFFNSQGKTVSFPPGCVLSPSLNILYTNDCRDKHKKRHLQSPFSLLQEGEVEPHLKLNLRETLTLHPSHHH